MVRAAIAKGKSRVFGRFRFGPGGPGNPTIIGCLILLPGRKSSVLGVSGRFLPQNPLEKVGGFAPHLFSRVSRWDGGRLDPPNR